MAFREKTAWISLFITLLIWGLYFADLMPDLGLGQVDIGRTLGKFLSSVVLVVLLQIVLTVAIAVWSPKDADAPADERERLIEFRSASQAYHVLSVLLVVAVLGAPALVLYHAHRFGTDPGLAATVMPMANGVLLALVLAEVCRSASQIVQFRRDAMA